jgi:cyclohexadienyl dehydratase
MLRHLKIAAAAAICAALTTAALAQSTPSRLDDIISRGTLRVGMTGDYRPFTLLNKSTNTFEGFDVDVAQALGKAMGVKVEFVQTSWPTMMKDFEADKFDIVTGGVSITLDRQKKGLFTTPIMREGKTPIARCSDIAKYNTIADRQVGRPRDHQSGRH